MKYLKLVLTPLFYCFLLSSCSKDIEVNKEDFSRFYPDEQPEPDPEPDPDPGANDFPASIVWEFTTGTQVANINDGSSAPVIGDNGVIFYVESRAGAESSLVAVIDQGEDAELKWASNALGFELPNAPSIGPDGNIYLNAWVEDQAISKFNAEDGSVMWSGGINTKVSNNTPAVDSDGNIYHGSRFQGAGRGGVFSWTSDGERRWEVTGVGAFYTAPVLSPDESTLYILNTDEGLLYALSTANGAPKWDPVGTGSAIHGSSLSMAEGVIYYTTATHVVAITDEGGNGSIKWQTQVSDASNSGVVIGPNGELYTGSRGGLLSLNPTDGTIIWTFDADVVESVPAVDEDGNIYVGATNGSLYIVNPDGELLKELELGDGAVNSPTIASDGTVYVEAKAGSTIELHKITVEGSGPADSPWPMKGQNVKNTGVAQE